MNNKLLISAMLALTSADLIHAPPSLGTVSSRKTTLYPSEKERQKKAAKRAEIAEWNQRVKDNQK